MYKTNNKLKSIVLWMVVAMGMLFPVGASAQDYTQYGYTQYGGLFNYNNWFTSAGELEYGLFRYSEEDGNYFLFNQQFGSGDNGDDGYALFNQTFGQEEVPLGSGLLILTAAGAGYALKKRKNNKK